MKRSPRERRAREPRGNSMPVAPRCRTCGHDPRRLDRMTAFLHRGAPLLTALVALRCSSAGLSAQEQTPTIRTETAGLVVDVIVTDHKGRHVPGQSAADFRAYENGTLQTIASFTPPPPGRRVVLDRSRWENVERLLSGLRWEQLPRQRESRPRLRSKLRPTSR